MGTWERDKRKLLFTIIFLPSASLCLSLSAYQAFFFSFLPACLPSLLPSSLLLNVESNKNCHHPEYFCFIWKSHLSLIFILSCYCCPISFWAACTSATSLIIIALYRSVSAFTVCIWGVLYSCHVDIRVPPVCHVCPIVTNVDHWCFFIR